jgi:hypothetical protein
MRMSQMHDQTEGAVGRTDGMVVRTEGARYQTTQVGASAR